MWAAVFIARHLRFPATADADAGAADAGASGAGGAGGGGGGGGGSAAALGSWTAVNDADISTIQACVGGTLANQTTGLISFINRFDNPTTGWVSFTDMAVWGSAIAALLGSVVLAWSMSALCDVVWGKAGCPPRVHRGRKD